MSVSAPRLASVAAATLVASVVVVGAGPVSADTPVDEPASFTSTLTVLATPGAVVDTEGEPVPGEAGALATFNLRLNSDEEIICFDITLQGVTPPYESPARTATHIHQAAAGAAGPPRIAFPDPQDSGDGRLRSSGCMQGPFTTGVTGDDGADTGTGFSLAQIEADPAAFSADTHTAAFTAGAVRGQLRGLPAGGVAAGGGGTAADGDPEPVPSTLAALAGSIVVGVGAAAVALQRRRPTGMTS